MIHLDKGVDDLNAVNEEGQNTLMLAAANRHLNVVEYVLYQGGDVNAQDNRGRTAIDLAAENDHLDVVLYLNEHR